MNTEHGQIGVPISVPRRSAYLEDCRRLLFAAKDARERGYRSRAAGLLSSATWMRLSVADSPVMCAIGDGRIVSGPVGQHPPQAWRDAYFAGRRPR